MKFLDTLKDILAGIRDEVENKPASGAQTESNPKSAALPDYSELIEGLVAEGGYTDYVPAGTAEAVCPSCGAGLENFPSRKINCPSCGGEIYVRTLSPEKTKVLLTAGQLEDFEGQRVFFSGRYDRRIAGLIEKMNRYSEKGGWIFLSPLDEKEKPGFAELHGSLIMSGSESEGAALRLLVRPDSRAWTKTWYDDPEMDTDPAVYEKEREEWFKNYGSA